MADIRAFRGFRYDLGRVGSLSDVVAPPYDVIDADLQQQLYDRSPYNAIRLELTAGRARRHEAENRYTRAARTLKDWIADDVLRQDTARSLYVYHQEFEVEGKTYTRRGFLARVRLEPFGNGQIFPHEQTMSGPKADRLKLFHATGMNLTPIFGLLSRRRRRGVRKCSSRFTRQGAAAGGDRPPRRRQPALARHRHARDQRRDRADGAEAGLHRRRPPPLRDRPAVPRGAQGRGRGAGRRGRRRTSCLMMLVSMSDPGLIILPTHRLVCGLAAGDGECNWQTRSREHFDIVERCGRTADAALGAPSRRTARRRCSASAPWRTAVVRGEAPRPGRDGEARPGAQRGVARPRREHPARWCSTGCSARSSAARRSASYVHR